MASHLAWATSKYCTLDSCGRFLLCQMQKLLSILRVHLDKTVRECHHTCLEQRHGPTNCSRYRKLDRLSSNYCQCRWRHQNLLMKFFSSSLSLLLTGSKTPSRQFLTQFQNQQHATSHIQCSIQSGLLIDTNFDFLKSERNLLNLGTALSGSFINN